MSLDPVNQAVVGRFAPSPTGPLHAGSLLAAVASYLDARARQGRWLVRIEDLDPPREIPGASDQILRTLETYALEWDGPVLFQSQRHALYDAHIHQLLERDEAYFCNCSRQSIARRGPVYDGFCRRRQASVHAPAAVRLKIEPRVLAFQDRIQGLQEQHLGREVGDFVIRRKDTLYAYQLAVVLDDAEQGITHVVRGSDLLDSTARQIFLQQRLGLPTPEYAHIPVLVNPQGQKLSKQTFAPALTGEHPGRALWQALGALGQQPPVSLCNAPPAEVLAWGVAHWDTGRVPSQTTLPDLPAQGAV